MIIKREYVENIILRLVIRIIKKIKLYVLNRILILRILFLSKKMKKNFRYKTELEFMIKRWKVLVFPYAYIQNYSPNKIIVYNDENMKMYYVIHKSKKLYFPRGMKRKAVQRLYNSLLIEQDESSPHMYFKKGFTCEPRDIFLDIGSAEGMLALEVADVVKKIYIFECDSKWTEALQKTFEPWNHKTIIINKYVSNKDTEEYISIDTLLDNNEDNLFIKIDIEGGEKLALLGMEKTLKTKKCKIACCTYHKQHDADEFNTFFNKLGYYTEFSKGYMLWNYGKNLEPPYFRKGIIRAKNNI